MSRDPIDILLADGISAAKKGHARQARTALLRALELDEENESAWLWLSSVVRNDIERRICLENVLALNPTSAAAKRGLERLDRATLIAATPAREKALSDIDQPLLPAKSVRQAGQPAARQRWGGEERPRQFGGELFMTRSGYDDVWARESDICAFCAAELEYDAMRCPKCGRKLTSSRFRYSNPSTDLAIYWVLLLGVAQFYLIRAISDLLVSEYPATMVWHIFLFGLVLLLALGVFMRRFWAYAASIATLILLLAGMLLDRLAGNNLGYAATTLSEQDLVGMLSSVSLVTLIPPLLNLIVPLQMAAILLALLYGIVRVGPDFERLGVRHVARTEKGLHGASQYYDAGKSYAQSNMWASAVLHWQRAAALEPTRPFYLRVLGEAYARLGFFERSLDVLESGHRLTVDPTVQAEFEQLLASVRQQIETSGPG